MGRQSLMLTRMHLDESGMTLTEVLLASAMASLIATAFLVIFSGFSRNVSLEEERAAALSDVQSAAADLTGELRQAVRLSGDAPIIEVLESAGAAAELIFYSDRADDAPGPERYRYLLTDCTATHCTLTRQVTVADAATPPWTFTSTPTSNPVVEDVMLGGDPVFRGADWATGSEIFTTSCDLSAPCEFALVQIVLRVDPDPNIAAEEPLLVRHEVRLRNAR